VSSIDFDPSSIPGNKWECISAKFSGIKSFKSGFDLKKDSKAIDFV
jgi:hypothetical protein